MLGLSRPVYQPAGGAPVSRVIVSTARAMCSRSTVLVDVLVADPAPAVARDLVAGGQARVDDGGISRERHRDAEDRQRQAALVEQAQHAPDAGARAVLVQRLHRQVAIGERGARR